MMMDAFAMKMLDVMQAGFSFTYCNYYRPMGIIDKPGASNFLIYGD